MSKWKRKYKKLRDNAQCRHVWAYLEIDRDTNEVFVKYRHMCGDTCLFLEAIDDE